MRFEHVAVHHRTSDFSCGSKDLDDWLKHHALDNETRRLSRTYVLLDDDNELVGYYSLTMGGVPRQALPSSYGERSPNYERGMVLIARLAVNSSRQGRGFGRDLLVDAIDRSVVAANEVAAQFISVDPIDESARAFYTHFGFRSVEGDTEGRMFVRVDEAIEALLGD